MLHLGKEVRAHLIDAGIVRAPGSEGEEPACWVQPVGGVPAPGEAPADAEKSDPVIGLMAGVGISPAPYEQEWITREALDVVIRASAAGLPTAMEVGRAIRRELADKRAVTMGDLRIEECIETSPLTVIVSDPAQGAIMRATFLFTVRDSAFG